MICSTCVAEVPDDDLFCENCGAKLSAVEEAPAFSGGCSCGAGIDEVDEDGFCLRCGKRVRRPASDHIEQELSVDFAAVSDRGLRHDRNEDRFAIAQLEGSCVMVLCDGVSTTSNSEVASEIVVETVLAELTRGLQDGSAVDTAAALTGAIRVAQEQLCAQGSEQGEQAPSTTVVTAVVRGNEVHVAWAGDSRAYWNGSSETVALTRDHSWLNSALAEGMSAEEANTSPQAHAITRWVGADADPEMGPEVMRFVISGEGLLLLCTDGLWNYAATPDEIRHSTLADSGPGESALSLASRLVAFALAQGGRDNVTVAALRVRPEAQAAEPSHATVNL